MICSVQNGYNLLHRHGLELGLIEACAPRNWNIGIIAHTPFGRFGEPEELLGTLHWLASDASKFVTGTLTVIDGGFDAFCI